MSSPSDASTLTLLVALVVAAVGGFIAWRGVNTGPSAPSDDGEAPRARDMAAVTGAVCLLVLAVVVVTWVPAAAAACADGDPDCDTFGRASAWTFTLMLAPIVALVAGLWRVGLFDLSTPEHEVTLTEPPAESRAEGQPEAPAKDPSTDEPAGASDEGASSEKAADGDHAEADHAEAETTTCAEPMELAPRVDGERVDDETAHQALLALLERRPLAVVLSHAEAAAVNGAALSLARRLDASIFMVGSRELTKSPDFESEHALDGRIGHEDELALAVAGRALEAVLFVDALGEFSDFTMHMLGELESACFADDTTAVARHCRVVLPCAGESVGDAEASGTRDEAPWPTRSARLARLDDAVRAALEAAERGDEAPDGAPSEADDERADERADDPKREPADDGAEPEPETEPDDNKA